MKKIRLIIASLLIMLASAIYAQPMNYNAMRNNARFLTDRMAYTLGITSGAIIDDIYRINYDYICGINEYLDEIACGYHSDLYLEVCYERDHALQRLLGEYLWRKIMNYDYFYRPISFSNRSWRFSIYSHDVRYSYYYFNTPTHYHEYRGGHFFNGIKYRMENHRRTMNSVDRRDHNIGVSRENRNNEREYNNQHNNRNENNYNNVNRDNSSERVNGAGNNRTDENNNVTSSERNNYNRGENTNRNEGNRYNRTNRTSSSENRSNNNVRSSSRNNSYNGSSNSSRGSYERGNNSNRGSYSGGSRGSNGGSRSNGRR